MKVLFFGVLSEIAQTDELFVSNFPTLQALLAQIKVNYPALQTREFKVSVNKKFVLTDCPLKEHDEIALLPPFSGG